jgi:hypothetical protein
MNGPEPHLIGKPLKRACDACNTRKCKCDGSQPCKRCAMVGIQCTYLRQKKKTGRPSGRRTRSKIERDLPSPVVMNKVYSKSQTSESRKLPLKVLLRSFSLYQQFLYGIEPLLPEQVFRNLEEDPSDSELYALFCALGGSCLSELGIEIREESYSSAPVTPATLISECLEARHLIEYTKNVSLNTILTSYFLHRYFGTLKDKKTTALFYIREAITVAHLYGLHTPDVYAGRPLQDQQTMRNLYFLLFVAERYNCVERGLPLMLEPLDFQIPESDRSLDTVSSFVDLVKIFSAPGKWFFENWSSQGKKLVFPSSWLTQLQHTLENPISVGRYSNDIQTLDVVATQNWIRALAFRVSKSSGYVTDHSLGVMGPEYPLTIARDLLSNVSHIPVKAFEVLGRGMELKLFEVANLLADVVISQSHLKSPGQFEVSPHDMLRGVGNIIFGTREQNRELRDTLARKLALTARASSPVLPRLLSLESEGSEYEDLVELSTDNLAENVIQSLDWLDDVLFGPHSSRDI